jgi:hypothetical protein
MENDAREYKGPWIGIRLFGGRLRLPIKRGSPMLKNLIDMMNELMQIPEAKEVLLKYGAKWE